MVCGESAARRQQIRIGAGRLTIHAKRKGTPVGTAAGLIAATALVHDLTLITRNVKDFAGLGVAIFNTWQP
jgi:predicted nucleic acid-binding protein